MLSRKEHHGWFLTEPSQREYISEMEKRFFEAIENPPQPSDKLVEMVRKYGKHADTAGRD
jgi:hypothetical protein